MMCELKLVKRFVEERIAWRNRQSEFGKSACIWSHSKLSDIHAHGVNAPARCPPCGVWAHRIHTHTHEFRNYGSKNSCIKLLGLRWCRVTMTTQHRTHKYWIFSNKFIFGLQFIRSWKRCKLRSLDDFIYDEIWGGNIWAEFITYLDKNRIEWINHNELHVVFFFSFFNFCAAAFTNKQIISGPNTKLIFNSFRNWPVSILFRLDEALHE